MRLTWSGNYNPDTGKGSIGALRYLCPACHSAGPIESSGDVPSEGYDPKEVFRLAVEMLDGRMLGQFTAIAKATPAQRLEAACRWYSRMKGSELPEADMRYVLEKRELDHYLRFSRRPYVGWCRGVEIRAKRAAEAAEKLREKLDEFERCRKNLRKCQHDMPIRRRLEDAD